IADMYLGAEHSRSLLYYAAWAADQATPEADRRGPLNRAAEKAIRRAAIWSSEAALRSTADAIQVHGGIGFTWEHDLHMYFKRARSNHALLPDTASLAIANV
ncbi:MAG TPA: acyl-CoA dehydrogenase family protein, partial [Actinomycetota bacterium]|nr:acyl-CoA dehydrogenase family protein [Actinomycetota bacterium]